MLCELACGLRDLHLEVLARKKKFGFGVCESGAGLGEAGLGRFTYVEM